MGGYPLYFIENTIIHLGHGYSVQLKGYDVWGKYFMTLIRFKQIHSDFDPEDGTYFCGMFFCQFRYFICIFNDKSRIIFVLGGHG